MELYYANLVRSDIMILTHLALCTNRIGSMDMLKRAPSTNGQLINNDVLFYEMRPSLSPIQK
jgi:hypothetical protein